MNRVMLTGKIAISSCGARLSKVISVDIAQIGV